MPCIKDHSHENLKLVFNIVLKIDLVHGAYLERRPITKSDSWQKEEAQKGGTLSLCRCMCIVNLKAASEAFVVLGQSVVLEKTPII